MVNALINCINDVVFLTCDITFTDFIELIISVVVNNNTANVYDDPLSVINYKLKLHIV